MARRLPLSLMCTVSRVPGGEQAGEVGWGRECGHHGEVQKDSPGATEQRLTVFIL